MDIATSVKPDELPWWKERFLPANHRLHCRIGPLTADIFRGSGEWLLGWESGEEGDSRDAQLELLEGMPEQEMVERFIFKRITGRLRLKPRLLDRHLVSRPRQPLYLPPGEATTLYVSSPVTVNIEVEQPGVSLRELPTVRLSDTWFGPSTRDGELCYASLTSARSHLTEVPDRPHRAITPVHIANKSATTLPLEKLSLPVPALSLYGAPEGRLWTEGLSLTRSSDSEFAVVEINRKPPPEAGQVELLESPRVAFQKGMLVRAFSLIFGS